MKCVNDGKRLYEWDVQNRLVRVIVPNEGEVRFRYRADGMRVEKQVVGGLTTKYIYDGQTVIGEIRSDGTKRWYVPGAMGYVCRIDEDANGQILARDYFVYDGLGSCRALVSSNGIVVAKYDYDVYGSVRGQEGQRANSFKYVAQIGHPTDEETGLIYMRARYYDPEVGRFVSEDPSKDGINWYWYADNNPILKIDPSGRFATLSILFTLEIDSERFDYDIEVNMASRSVIDRLNAIVNTYNLRLEAIARSRLGADNGVAVYLRFLTQDNHTYALYQIVFDPFSLKILHFELKAGSNLIDQSAIKLALRQIIPHIP